VRRRALRTVRTAALTVGGLGCLVAAAWTWHRPVGLVAAGLALLLLEALTRPNQGGTP